MFGFAEITSLSRFYEQVGLAGLKVTDCLEHSDSYKRTIEDWMGRLAILCPEKHLSAPVFIKYMAVANKGWNKTTAKYLLKMQKLE